MSNDRLDYSNSIEGQDVIYDAGPENFSRLPRSSTMDISHQLQRMNLDSDIIVAACDEYNRLDMKFRRGKRWNAAVFHCIDTAHTQLSIPTDPKHWMDILDISMKDLSEFIDHMVCKNMTIDMMIDEELMICECGDECTCKEILGDHHTIFMDPCYYLEYYSIELDIFPDDEVRDHIDAMEKISNITKKYVDDYPQVIACGVIIFYCQFMSIENPREKLVEFSQKSQQSISRVIRIQRCIFD